MTAKSATSKTKSGSAKIASEPFTKDELRAARHLMVGFEGKTVPSWLAQLLEAQALFGVILFRRNFDSDAEASALAKEILARSKGSVLLGIDQEGGRVERLRENVTKLPAARWFGEQKNAVLTKTAGFVLGTELRGLGFDINFAPVLDVDTNPKNPIIGDRAYGRDVKTVVEQGRAFHQGLLMGGVSTCGKHFPGHGDTELDSHLALPRVSRDEKSLREVELSPFAQLAGNLPMIMTAHVIFDALDDVPATLSRKIVYELLREEMKFAGVIVSDDLEMKAIVDHYGIGDASVRAIEAGCDALLVCQAEASTRESLKAIAARMSEDEEFLARCEASFERLQSLHRMHRNVVQKYAWPANEKDAETLRAAFASTPAE